MPSEPLHLFDPRRNFQWQGFAGRGATTTIQTPTETGVLHLGDLPGCGGLRRPSLVERLRLLQPPPAEAPVADLSGLKLEFDIEYDQTLDGAIRFDAAKLPSVSWEMWFVTGAGDIHEVRLRDHATVVSGTETAATVLIDISGEENMGRANRRAAPSIGIGTRRAVEPGRGRQRDTDGRGPFWQ
jgi:hypothetical protein